MKREVLSFVLGILITYPILQITALSENSPVKIFTCPGCKNTIINLIENSKDRIMCEMYIMTNKEYIEKLKEADKRGVNIMLLLDNNTYNRETASFLNNTLIKYKLTDRFKLLHSKACVFDDVLFLGSHNWSYTSAENNREINAIIYSKEAVDEFLNIFWRDWNES